MATRKETSAGKRKNEIWKEKRLSSERPWKKMKIDSVLGREIQFCLALQGTDLQVTETSIYATGSRGKWGSEGKTRKN